jgi:hypothetical protein
MTKLYNAVIKEKFISKYPPQSQTPYRNAFEKCRDFENQQGRDIYDFHLYEFELLFKQIENPYLSRLRTIGRIYTAYINWAITEGLLKHSKNPLAEVKTSWFEQFVRKAKLFYTDVEILYIENLCKNKQDAVIIRLVFEGVLGQAAAEIRNLKITDVKPQNGMLLTDEDGSTREIDVSPRCIQLVEQAFHEKRYYKSNGEMKPTDNVRDYTDLLENEFVIRSSNTGKDKNIGAVDKFVLYRRISTIEKQLGLENFNIKNISRSGMLAFAVHLMKEHYKTSELNLGILMDISERFKVNSYNSLRSFITNENVRKLYGDF